MPALSESSQHRKKMAHHLAVEALEARELLAGDPVLRWNALLLDAVRADGTAPPVAARNMAMVQVAVYDAVEAITRNDSPFRVIANVPRGASPEAAVASAAHRVLAELYPSQAATFDAALADDLAALRKSPQRDQGVSLGETVARAILDWRSHDGADAVVAYTPGTGIGEWRPTAPGNRPALLPGWGSVTPFALEAGSEFRPDGPPAPGSDEYASALNEVKSLGKANSTTRTADQTQIALFWADDAGTATPPGHWNEIAEQVAAGRGLSLEENARLFALLDTALADAGIAAWDAKFADNFWRPITAIRLANSDGDPQTTADPTWTPLLATPPFPSYVSGHSTFSASAAAVLSSFFHTDDVHFTIGSDALPGVVRSFNSFSEAAGEAGRSRIYGGIHYAFDDRDGQALGTAVGEYVIQNFMGPRHDRSSAVADQARAVPFSVPDSSQAVTTAPPARTQFAAIQSQSAGMARTTSKMALRPPTSTSSRPSPGSPGSGDLDLL